MTETPIEVEVRGVKARIEISTVPELAGEYLIIREDDGRYLNCLACWGSGPVHWADCHDSPAAAHAFIDKVNERERKKVAVQSAIQTIDNASLLELAATNPPPQMWLEGEEERLFVQPASQPPQGEPQLRERLTKDDPPGWYLCTPRGYGFTAVRNWSTRFLRKDTGEVVDENDYHDFRGPLTLDGLAAAIREKISNWRVVANVLGGRENEIHREMYHRCASELESILEAHKIAGAGGGTPASLNTANL